MLSFNEDLGLSKNHTVLVSSLRVVIRGHVESVNRFKRLTAALEHKDGIPQASETLDHLPLESWESGPSVPPDTLCTAPLQTGSKRTT